MKITITSWLTGSALFEGDFSCLADAVKAAVSKSANLRNANLRNANLRNADLRNADLGGADLGGADLGNANLRNANLGNANLGNANLGGADLGGVFAALPILKNPDAEILKIVKSKKGALHMQSWHECETTHCRAGWYITLSGPAGKMLEAVYGSSAAGALIFSKAYPGRKVPNFVASNKEAMADMKENAKLFKEAKK